MSVFRLAGVRQSNFGSWGPVWWCGRCWLSKENAWKLRSRESLLQALESELPAGSFLQQLPGSAGAGGGGIRRGRGGPAGGVVCVRAGVRDVSGVRQACVVREDCYGAGVCRWAWGGRTRVGRVWGGRWAERALVRLACSRVFQVPPLPVGPPIAPLASMDSLSTALPDLPAATGPAVPSVPAPSQYFSPAVILPSLPLSAAAAAPLPASPALPLQAVKLPHPTGAPLAVPCRTIVPNVAATATAIPLLAVAPQGVAALSIHPAAVAQLPAQPVYPAAFPQMVPSDVPPSPLHAAQNVRAAPSQPAPPTLPQPHQPSVTHLPEQAAAAGGAGSQVIHLPRRARPQVPEDGLSC